MSMERVVLTRTDTGYATHDGRWSVVPVIMGDGPRSKGDREWLVTDTTGQAAIGYAGRTSTTVHALYAARSLIAAYTP